MRWTSRGSWRIGRRQPAQVVVLAGEHRLRVRCHRCSTEYANERRRARRPGLPFGIPKEQLPLPDFTPGEQGEQAHF